jgi:hypothetical protein
MQFDVTVRNAIVDAIETAIGSSPIFKIFDGALPASPIAADNGDVMAQWTAPSDWLSNASDGSKSKLGTWSTNASGTGTATYFRVYNAAGNECRGQGVVSMAGGGGDMILDNTSFANGQPFTVSAFTLTAGNV